MVFLHLWANVSVRLLWDVLDWQIFILHVGYYDDQAWTVQLIAGKVFIPLSYVIGVPWNETEMVGRLIGVKTMVNEFVAFQEMQNMTLTVCGSYVFHTLRGCVVCTAYFIYLTLAFYRLTFEINQKEKSRGQCPIGHS